MSAATRRSATAQPHAGHSSVPATSSHANSRPHGDQVAYTGHLLYTFADDQAGQVTGQGVQGFFVATPGLAPLAGSSTSAAPLPSGPSGSSYGY